MDYDYFIIINDQNGEWKAQDISKHPHSKWQMHPAKIDKKEKIVVFMYQRKFLCDSAVNRLAYTTSDNWEKRHTIHFDERLICDLTTWGGNPLRAISFKSAQAHLISLGFLKENIIEETHNVYREYVRWGVVQDPCYSSKDEGATVLYYIEPGLRTIKKTGLVLKCKNNESFVNKFFALQKHKGERTRYVVGDYTIMWIVSLDEKERCGWSNFDYGDIIAEDMNNIEDYHGIPVEEFAKKFPYRIVVDRKGAKGCYEYSVKGFFKFDKDCSVPSERHFYVRIV